jgi:hypothetical protein
MKILKPSLSKLLFAFIIFLIGIALFIPFIKINPYWWVSVACKNEFCGLLGNQSYTLFWVLIGIIWGNQTWNEYTFFITDIFTSHLFYLLIPVSYLISSVILTIVKQVTRKTITRKKFKKN